MGAAKKPLFDMLTWKQSVAFRLFKVYFKGIIALFFLFNPEVAAWKG